jgi:NADH-quinone oxidoreductase subunit C
VSDTATSTETEETPEPEAPPQELVHGCPVTERLGQRVVHCHAGQYLDLITNLRDGGYDMCMDLAAVDYLTHPLREVADGIERERFEVVVNLVSSAERQRIRVRCQVPEADPALPTLFELWPGTEAMEREVYDLMGIRFDGHPDLTRILMPEDWEGHPLRKDYAVGRIPVQFKGAPPPR